MLLHEHPIHTPVSRERVRVRASPVSGHTLDSRYRRNHGRLRKGLPSGELRMALPRPCMNMKIAYFHSNDGLRGRDMIRGLSQRCPM